MTEKQLQGAVMDMLRLFNWRAYHTFDSRRSQAGFPDIIALRGSRMLVLELKSAKGRLRGPQREWLDAFEEFSHATNAGSSTRGSWDPNPWVDVLVVRPEGLEELAEVLR